MTACQHQAAPRSPPEVSEGGQRRYYEIGGVTVEVHSDLPISDRTFGEKFRSFEVEGPGRDTISIRHHFGLPELDAGQLGREVYCRPPWIVYGQEESWTYVAMAPSPEGPRPYCVAVFAADYRCGEIYHASADSFLRGNLHSLTTFPTDQILLAQVFARRGGCVMHSAAAVLDGQGLLFAGHSEAGKSTSMKLLGGRARILCDDRNIVRRWPEGFRVHGTWSHGEIAEVSAAGAPLRAILFLCKSNENRLVPLRDRKAVLTRLLACLIRPLESVAWWDRSLELMGTVVREVPCYEMHFDLSGRIIRELEGLVPASPGGTEGDAA